MRNAREDCDLKRANLPSRFTVRSGTPAFFVLAKSSKEEESFLKEYSLKE